MSFIMISSSTFAFTCGSPKEFSAQDSLVPETGDSAAEKKEKAGLL